MFVALFQKLRRSLGRSSAASATTDNPAPEEEEKIDFKEVVRTASNHHRELAHACQLARPTGMCTRCYLSAGGELQHLDQGNLSTLQRQEVLTLAFVHSDALVHTCGVAGGGTCTRCLVESLGAGSPIPITSMDAMLRRWEQECPPKEKMLQQKSLLLDPASPFSPLVAAVVWLVSSATNLFLKPATERQTPPAKHQLQVLPASRPHSDPTQKHPKSFSRVPFPLPLPYSAWYPVSVPLPLPVLLPPVPPRSLSLSPPLPLPPSVTLALSGPSALRSQQEDRSTLVEVSLRQAIRERDNIPHTCKPHLKDFKCVRCLLAGLAPLLGLP